MLLDLSSSLLSIHWYNINFLSINRRLNRSYNCCQVSSVRWMIAAMGKQHPTVCLPFTVNWSEVIITKETFLLIQRLFSTFESIVLIIFKEMIAVYRKSLRIALWWSSLAWVFENRIFITWKFCFQDGFVWQNFCFFSKGEFYVKKNFLLNWIEIWLSWNHIKYFKKFPEYREV